MADYTINYEEISEYLNKYIACSDEKQKKHLQNIIVLAAMPLVKKIGHGLARRNSDPVEDIIQVGYVGLVKAIKSYNPKISKQFRVYATYYITGEIRHYLRDKVSMIRPPREIYELAFRVNNVMQRLMNEIGDEPSEDVIAELLGTSVRKVKEVIDIDRRKQTLSLDQILSSCNDDSISLLDQISDSNQYNLQSFNEDKILLENAISKLDSDLKELILLNYFEDMSQKQISDKIGLSRMQVSRKIKKALNDLLVILSEKDIGNVDKKEKQGDIINLKNKKKAFSDKNKVYKV